MATEPGKTTFKDGLLKIILQSVSKTCSIERETKFSIKDLTLIFRVFN